MKLLRVLALIGFFAVLATSIAQAGPFDWFTYTGEGNVNDVTDVLNWRWANVANMPSGVAYFGNPANSGQISTRTMLEGPYTLNIPTGQTVGAAQVSSTPEIGGGMTVNINGGTLSVSQMIDNMVWTDPRVMAALWYAASPPRPLTQAGYDQAPALPKIAAGNSWPRVFWGGATGLSHSTMGLDSTVKVNNGGSLTVGDMKSIFANSGNLVHSSSSAYFHPGIGSVGISVEGEAHVAITTFQAGAEGLSGRTIGGGFLTLKGYDPDSSIAITTLTLRGAGYDGEFGGPSDPARLGVILDSTVSDGNFNKIVANTLTLSPSYITNQSGKMYDQAVALTITEAGYAPQLGDVIPIIVATTIQQVYWNGSSNVTAPGLGNITVNGDDMPWDTDFFVGGTKYQLHQTHGADKGIFLEVTGVVPEPSTVALLALAGLGLIGLVVRRKSR